MCNNLREDGSVVLRLSMTWNDFRYEHQGATWQGGNMVAAAVAAAVAVASAAVHHRQRQWQQQGATWAVGNSAAALTAAAQAVAAVAAAAAAVLAAVAVAVAFAAAAAAAGIFLTRKCAGSASLGLWVHMLQPLPTQQCKSLGTTLFALSIINLSASHSFYSVEPRVCAHCPQEWHPVSAAPHVQR